MGLRLVKTMALSKSWSAAHNGRMVDHDAKTRPPQQSTKLNLALAATALLSAWLLFQVQPMVAKRILPWFGGGTAVWTTTMLFFQSALFLGYLYAHFTTRLAPRRQVATHVVLLAAAAILAGLLGVLPRDGWKPEGSDLPALHILAMLAASVGLPYVMLAATAPLVQVWFSRANPGRSPYRLYALSNIGSMAALLSYPLLVEPNLGLTRQGLAWSAMFVGFAVACGWSGVQSLRWGRVGVDQATEAVKPEATGNSRPAWLQYFFWIALPACASVALLAITNYLCLDVAPIPLLWVAPLAVYLLTFILTFDGDRWYRRDIWLPIAAILSFVAVYTWHENLKQMEDWLDWQVGLHLTLLLAIGMVCHGELARMRPAANRLTSFYLCISAGGAIGGLLVGVAAPLAFSDYYELPLSVLAAWLLAMIVLVTDRQSRFYDGRTFVGWVGMAGLLIALGVSMYRYAERDRARAETLTRSFFGVLKVRERRANTPEAYLDLTNGQISHGGQFRLDALRRVPIDYYHRQSGIGLWLEPTRPTTTRCVGVIGLGAGTLAAYAESDDVFRFYDVNPQVMTVADYHFTYLRDARERGAKIELIEGDGRLSLERESSQNFDVLVLDAFNSDAIPAHLLTLEAIELYLSHLKKPNGVLALHVSNSHLDLEVVVKAAAEKFGLEAAYVHTPSDGTAATESCTWIMLGHVPGQFARIESGEPLAEATADRAAVTWTDDYSNLLNIIQK